METEKFKTGCISVNLITGLNPDTAARSALMPRVLRRGSAEYPDMHSISAALDELYGARVEPLVRKKGELHCIGMFTDFPDNRFLPGEDSLFERVSSLLCGILLSPDLKERLLRTDYVDSEKRNLIDDIRSAVNDKRSYSVSRLLEEMCAGEAYGVRRLGREEEALGITPETLTGHYYDLLSRSKIEVFYCGSETHNRVVDVLRDALKGLPERDHIVAPKTEIVLYPPDGAPKKFTEKLDVVQGRISVGFRLGNAMKGRPDLPGLIVLNAVYGAGDTSKLFLNVREKLSLCYQVNSMIDKHKGVMIVSAGVESTDFSAALDEILAQIEDIKRGAVAGWELEAAKRSVVTSVKQALDRPGGLEDMYLDRSISEFPYDPEDLCMEIEGVTLDRVVEAASWIGTDSIYFLTGEGGEAEFLPADTELECGSQDQSSIETARLF